MQRYDTYKDSGVKWLGEIPSHWEVLALKHILTSKKVLVGKHSSQYELLSLTLKGVVKRDMDNPEGKFPASFDTYQAVEPNDFIFCNFDNEETPRAVGLSPYKGMITGAYDVLSRNNPKLTDGFLIYYFLYIDDAKRFKPLYKGLRKTVPFDSFMSYKIPVPSIKEQNAIVSYLDTATAKIDAAIAQQQKMIDLLNERKQIIINRAVTKGLNPNAKMKDSGVEWIGEVPEGWDCRKLKSICANTQYSIKTGPFGSQLKGDDIQEFGDVPIYNQRVVIDNDCNLFNSYVSKAKAASLKSFVVNSKDLLITTRGTIGKSTIVPNDAPDGILHPCIIAIRLNFDLCCNEYLQFFFQSIAFNTDMMLKSNATTIEVIYSYNLKECFVPLPPIDEQKQIVEYLNKELVRINQTIDATNNQISLLQERKQIIINEVVTGKIKVV